MDNITNFSDQKTKPSMEKEEEEEEEALSLRDFPLNSDELEKRDSAKIQDKRRSSSEPSEFFEFFNDFSSEMSNAEDIIFCGKLVPYKNPPRFHHQILKSLSADDATHLSMRRYCESLPELTSARPNTMITTRRLTKNSRSMDCKKLRRSSNLLIMKPQASDIHRSSSKSSAKSEGSKVSKPRWFVMMFGPLKLQQEMDLRDMKNRQVRRNPGSLFPGMDAGGKAPASRSDRRSFWGHDWLRVLSCKNHASVAVTASIGLVPHF